MASDNQITVLTYLGEEWCVRRLVGVPGTSDGSWVAWGSGIGVATKADEILIFEEDEGRMQGAVTLTGVGVTAKYEVEATLVANDTKTITEAATFSAALGSQTIIIRTTFDGIDLQPTDEITFTFSLDPA